VGSKAGAHPDTPMVVQFISGPLLHDGFFAAVGDALLQEPGKSWLVLNKDNSLRGAEIGPLSKDSI
jgi:hypothetical protein